MPSLSNISLCACSMDLIGTIGLLVPWTENHLSSFKCGFLNIFSRQNLLCSLSRLLFLLRWNKYGAKKCLKNHIPFDFWDDLTLANQGARKAIEKRLKELPWNQQWRCSCCWICLLVPNELTTLWVCCLIFCNLPGVSKRCVQFQSFILWEWIPQCSKCYLFFLRLVQIIPDLICLFYGLSEKWQQFIFQTSFWTNMKFVSISSHRLLSHCVHEGN